ncbi:hypothetical protein CYY_002448 [Polysphondylium violaceum]|uniref:Intron-binding protein aquarius n=2 Tax=Polysphondylium violaceum TaxID=133409 RepID=A0A8J4PZ13_9MYCE|nr:hypothetical protein CYY_002448 [Polysphondylium violaceum]
MVKGKKNQNDDANKDNNNTPNKKLKTSTSTDTGSNDNSNSNNNNSNSSSKYTLSDILSDDITKFSMKHWLNGVNKDSFETNIVEKIYNTEMLVSPQRIQILELSHYLENYLWPNFNAEVTEKYFIMSIIMMINEKTKEGLNSFECLHSNEPLFKTLFEKILQLQLNEPVELVHYIRFLINSFQNVEDAMVRNECLKIVSYPIYINLSPGRYQLETRDLPLPIQKKLQIFKKKVSTSLKSNTNDKIEFKYQRFLLDLMKQFINILTDSITNNNQEQNIINYCERFMELMIDLMTQITTRRFFFALQDDFHLLIRVDNLLNSIKDVKKKEPYQNLIQLLGIYKFYSNFDINNFTGDELSDDQITGLHYLDIQELQKTIFKDFPEIKEFSLRNISFIESKDQLIKNLGLLSEERLNHLAYLLNLQSKETNESKEFLIDLFVSKYQKKVSLIKEINSVSVYPTESLLWDENVIPNSTYHGDKTLSLPKLNLQFLSFNDYLMRNFFLSRLESAYEIRSDIEDAIKRLDPQLEDGKTIFKGWSRMALPLSTPFKITSVHEPSLGETKPKYVNGYINLNLQNIKSQSIRNEWDSIKDYDVLFLITIDKTTSLDNSNEFIKKFGIKSIRGCQVLDTFDNNNQNNNSKNNNNNSNNSTTKSIKVSLDTNQYELDQDNLSIYNNFNIVLRRNPKENNFKAIMDTIISLTNSKTYLPDWFSSIFLGYPNDSSMASKDIEKTILFNDTFLSLDHLKSSFPDKSIEISENCKDSTQFKITFKKDDQLFVDTYSTNGKQMEKRNKIKFTPTQVKAIQTGTSEGLCLIVGPPGTGKTDIAVQIVSNIYHNCPNQRTLIVTHSNQALNQLFEKIYKLDINERYLLRLGHGQKQLDAGGKDFTKSGRIDFWLNLRLEQLSKVDRLAKSINIMDDVAYTCDTATQFFSYHVLSRWEKYLSDCSTKGDNQFLIDHFPFTRFFENVLKTNPFDTKDFEKNQIKIQSLWKEIQEIFNEIQECQVFELLKSPTDRYNYLLLKQSKIVAMTCTHAAMKRDEFIKLGFKFDNLVMEESGQISDIESFIPLQLQNINFSEKNRLKRVVLIGDHNQLPPVVKNQSLQKFSHFDQSLFTRLIRLQIPHITLDRQGRSRPSISQLFTWRYKGLEDLEIVKTKPEFQLSNLGFAYEYQLIDVDDGQESEPAPYFYQNLQEAEYIVATYQYMRMLGYSDNQITILTTYNGQKVLLREIFNIKCKNNPLFGMPHKITTIDKYQGQQNDIVLLSLVRTKSYGHIRDIRRLIVAMSRARLGLYVFCKKQFFSNCYETITVFNKLLARPTKLILTKSQDQNRKITDPLDSENTFEIENYSHMQALVNSNL